MGDSLLVLIVSLADCFLKTFAIVDPEQSLLTAERTDMNSNKNTWVLKVEYTI